MKTLWARVGMSVKVTDAQYEMFRNRAISTKYTEAHGYDIYDDYWDDELESLFRTKGVFDGDSYVPMVIWDK